MDINVNYFGQLAELSGDKKATITIKKATINDLLENIAKSNPQITEKVFAVFLNNKRVTDFDVSLSPNDEVSLMPPFAGG